MQPTIEGSVGTPMRAPAYSDFDTYSSSDETDPRGRATLINIAQALEEDIESDSDQEIDLHERTAEVTFDVLPSCTSEFSEASTDPANRGKNWTQRILQRTRSKPQNVEKKHSAATTTKPDRHVRERPTREHRHFNLSRQQPNKEQPKPATEVKARYRLCPYGTFSFFCTTAHVLWIDHALAVLPGMKDIHAHLGAELIALQALPQATIDDNSNNKFSSVIAMHFHELPEVARAMNAAGNASPTLVKEPSRPGPPASSPSTTSTRRNSDPAPPSSLAELEQQPDHFAFRRSEASAPLCGTTSSGGFVFAD